MVGWISPKDWQFLDHFLFFFPLICCFGGGGKKNHSHFFFLEAAVFYVSRSELWKEQFFFLTEL